MTTNTPTDTNSIDGNPRDKVRESRLRRLAARQGLVLRRSRRRDGRSPAFGTYQLVDAQSDLIAAGDGHGPYEGFGLSLDDIQRALKE